MTPLGAAVAFVVVASSALHAFICVSMMVDDPREPRNTFMACVASASLILIVAHIIGHAWPQ